MIEVKIYCKSGIKVPDLGLDLEKGQTVWISDEDFRHSKHIKHAQGIGAVEVQRRQRMRESRPPPPFVSRVWKKQPTLPQPSFEKREENMSNSELLKEVRALREDIKEQTKLLVAALQNIQVKTVQARESNPQRVIQEDGPLYIPTDIVKDTGVELSVKSSESFEDVDEATSLLRQMRKK